MRRKVGYAGIRTRYQVGMYDMYITEWVLHQVEWYRDNN